jgi:uncharacterized alkaline shock family protein YloU
MVIYALVGRSGTGKSSKAQVVAGTYNIEFILDDGLLIKGNKVLAGQSAKREDTRIAAIKRAVFMEDKHRNEVKESIKEYNPQSILVIGTSEHMINSIMKALDIGNEYRLIRIEDISTPEEIDSAIKSRRGKGKHVIPVPTFEIKKDFSGYFVDSIKLLVNRNEKNEVHYEKTVVRPTFSYLGKYEIKDAALKAIINITSTEVENVSRVLSIDIKNEKIGIIVTMGVVLTLNAPLQITSGILAERVKNNLEYMTGLNVLEVNIVVKGVKVD